MSLSFSHFSRSIDIFRLLSAASLLIVPLLPLTATYHAIFMFHAMPLPSMPLILAVDAAFIDLPLLLC